MENPYEADRWVCFDVADDWYKPVDSEAPHYTGSELTASHDAYEEGYHSRDDEVQEKELEKKQIRSVCEDLRSDLKSQDEIVNELVEACRNSVDALARYNSGLMVITEANKAIAKATQ